MIATRLDEMVALLEAIPVASGPGYRLARTADDLEGASAERLFVLQLTARLGPQDTGRLDPRTVYSGVLILQLSPSRVDGFADMKRLATEANVLARALETSNLEVLVGAIEFAFEEGTDTAAMSFNVVVREA